MALAAGTYLATQGISLVYLQNSGLGNTVNPLLSLADSEVYGIPMILLIGWRGEPNVHDEPQHVKQGFKGAYLTPKKIKRPITARPHTQAMKRARMMHMRRGKLA